MKPHHDARAITAYIGLGSNLGDAPATLAAAVMALGRLDGIRLDAVSPLYLTEPQDDPNQPWFANQVARLVCPADVTPHALLRALQDIEHALGRTRDPVRRYAPRTIDLDLLTFGTVECATPELTLPHPRMRERAFVLRPLCDLAPDLALPCGRTAQDLLRAVPHRVDGARIYQSPTTETP